MTNPGAAARRYHEATKHSPQSVAASRHVLDWANQPMPYKIYPTLEPIPLPIEIVPTTLPAVRALLEPGVSPADRPAVPDLATIARLCILSNGVTRVRRHAGGELAFRAAGTTGALYHVELYLACADLPGLGAGLYHFGAHDNSLRQLRSGDHRAALVAASGEEEAIARAPLVVVATSTFWRNAWKYQARAWRHAFWDSGTVLANLLALATAGGLPAWVVLGFADDQVNALLDVDPEREAAVYLVAIGDVEAPPPAVPRAPPLNLPTLPLSRREIRYRLIEETQADTSFATPDEAAAWRDKVQELPAPRPSPAGPVVALPMSEQPSSDPIERVIRRRGSTRRFARAPIGADALATLLQVAAAPLPGDFAPESVPLTDLFLIVNAVEAVEPGAYLVREDGIGLERLRSGDRRSAAGSLALGQDLAADASVNLYWLADLDRLLAALGDRGYRAAQLDAAIRAGRAWLAAYALRLGATGLTFFDDEVTRFFSPRAAGMSVMFLLAAGHAASWRGR